MAEKYQEFTSSQKMALYVSMGALGKCGNNLCSKN